MPRLTAVLLHDRGMANRRAEKGAPVSRLGLLPARALIPVVVEKPSTATPANQPPAAITPQ